MHEKKHRDRDRNHPLDSLVHFSYLQDSRHRPVVLDQPDQLQQPEAPEQEEAVIVIRCVLSRICRIEVARLEVLKVYARYQVEKRPSLDVVRGDVPESDLNLLVPVFVGHQKVDEEVHHIHTVNHHVDASEQTPRVILHDERRCKGCH